MNSDSPNRGSNSPRTSTPTERTERDAQTLGYLDGPENRGAENRLSSDSFLLTGLSQRFRFWSPVQLPSGVSVNISSSRLGQKPESHEAWFDALRTIAVQIQSEQKFLISAQGVTTDQFVSRIAELFEIPIVTFKPIPDDANSDWFHRTSEQAINQQQSLSQAVWYRQTESSPEKLNVNDLLISAARVAVLLSVRKSGNIFAAAHRRLENQSALVSRPVSQTTRLLIDRKLTSKTVETGLLEKGASGWWLYDSKSGPGSSNPVESQAAAVADLKPPTAHLKEPVILDLDEIASDQFVLHWTRRRVGPWPDQTQTDFLDDLIFRNSRRHHGQLSALCRILASRKILGSSNLTRDPRSVVCFSDIPLEQLKERRVFRSHLSRWDFEPYGLAIDRDLLRDLGARPVIYGDNSTWDSLSLPDRPFFQSQRSASEKIDWKLENEWRIVGDLRLELIPYDQALVFVATEAEANTIGDLCHWPIVVMGTADKQ